MLGENTGSRETAKRIPTGTIGAEIGVWRGETTSKFLKRHLKHLYLVDPWSLTPWFDVLSPDQQERTLSRYGDNLVGSKDRGAFQAYYDKVYSDVFSKFGHLPNVTIHRTSSEEFFRALPCDSLDWVYIDGDHSYEGCLSDLEYSLLAVKEGGSIFCDDYGNKPGVVKAVDEFSKKYRFKVQKFAKQQAQMVVNAS